MLKRAKELDPAAVWARMVLAQQYMLMKRHAAAIRELEAAAELEPKAEIYVNLAECFFSTDEKDKAFEAIDKAIKLDHNQRKTFRSDIEREQRYQRWQNRKGNVQ